MIAGKLLKFSTILTLFCFVFFIMVAKKTYPKVKEDICISAKIENVITSPKLKIKVNKTDIECNISTDEKKEQKKEAKKIEENQSSKKEVIEKEKKRKKKKRFPWLLAVGAAVISIGLVLILLKKKNFTLTTIKGDGVDGKPDSGTVKYKKGTKVNYSYTLQAGYTNLTVTLDGVQLPPEGSITMDANHTLEAKTNSAIAHIESIPTKAEVFVDSKAINLITPCDISLDAGTHEVLLVNSNFGESKRTIDFIPGKKYDIKVTLSSYRYEFVIKWDLSYPNQGNHTKYADISLDSNGNIYAVDSIGAYVLKFSNYGNLLIKWGGFGKRDGRMDYPSGIAIDSNNHIFVSDMNNQRIQEFEPNGVFIRTIGRYGNEREVLAPSDVAVDSKGNLFVAEFNNARIKKFDYKGNFVTKWGSFGSGDIQFNNPERIIVDSNDDIYVSDCGNNRIQKFSNDGKFILKWGTQGNGNGEFMYTQGIGIDKNGYVYVADGNNHRVQKFTHDGTYLTKWGLGGSGNGEFVRVDGVAIDDNGFVFVSDRALQRIQKFKMSSQTEDNGLWSITASSFTNSSIPEVIKKPVIK